MHTRDGCHPDVSLHLPGNQQHRSRRGHGASADRCKGATWRRQQVSGVGKITPEVRAVVCCALELQVTAACVHAQVDLQCRICRDEENLSIAAVEHIGTIR
jgi:hypothetical protein